MECPTLWADACHLGRQAVAATTSLSRDALPIRVPVTEGTLEKHCATCRCFTPRKRVGGIKRDAADIRFSKMIRERDAYTCQRCHKYLGPSPGLHAAHMFSRRIKATRFDQDNACALCYGCHQYLDSHPNEKLTFFRDRLGDEKFDALEARAKGKRNR